MSNAEQRSLLSVDVTSMEDGGDLEKALLAIGREASDRLTFFLRTLPAVAAQTPRPARANSDTAYSEAQFLRSVPSVTQLITTYTEEVMVSAATLRAFTGSCTNLEHMIRAQPDEWRHVEERARTLGLYWGAEVP